MSDEEQEKVKSKADIYWQVQVDTITDLARVGLHFRLDQRIPPMGCMKAIRGKREKYQEHLLLDAVAALSRLVLYRTQGYEPEVIGDVYKKEE